VGAPGRNGQAQPHLAVASAIDHSEAINSGLNSVGKEQIGKVFTSFEQFLFNFGFQI
jgi:hypothetical protein